MQAAEAEARALTSGLDAAETDELKMALGAGGTGKGAAAAVRGSAGALKDLERRQKSRATRLQRDALDRALVDLAGFYRDVLLVQAGSPVLAAHPEVAARCRWWPGRSTRPARWCDWSGAGLPGGDRAERQAPDRRRGDDRGAAAALSRLPGTKAR